MPPGFPMLSASRFWAWGGIPAMRSPRFRRRQNAITGPETFSLPLWDGVGEVEKGELLWMFRSPSVICSPCRTSPGSVAPGFPVAHTGTHLGIS